MTIDLGSLFGDDGSLPPRKEQPVDNSGRPCPTRALATLSSGVVVECAVVYGGMFRGERRYRVVAEIDWATVRVVSVEMDRWPPDVYVSLRIPEEWDDQRAKEFGHGIEWRVAGNGYLPQRMERTKD